MKKLIPIYVLLLAIFVVFTIQLRETQALRAELTRIGKQQLRATDGPYPPGAGIPVFITNQPIEVSSR